VPEEVVCNLNLLGFSGIANVLSAIKFAKYYEMGEQRCRSDRADRFDGTVQQPHPRVPRGASVSLPILDAETFARDLHGETPTTCWS
jgi:hypothetical protein